MSFSGIPSNGSNVFPSDVDIQPEKYIPQTEVNKDGEIRVYRPKPIESEKELTPSGEGIISQPKFKSGNLINNSIRGHVKPESYNFKTSEATEVKNFTFNANGANPSSIAGLVRQIRQRQSHLPAGSTQLVIVDVRGQFVSKIQQMYFKSQVLSQTRTPRITIEFKIN